MHLPPPIRRTSGTVASTRSRAREGGPYRQSAAASASPCTACVCVCVCVHARDMERQSAIALQTDKSLSHATYRPQPIIPHVRHAHRLRVEPQSVLVRQQRPVSSRRAAQFATMGSSSSSSSSSSSTRTRLRLHLTTKQRVARATGEQRGQRRNGSAAQALARTLTVPLRRVEQVLAYGVVLDAEPQMRASLQRLRRRRRRLLQRVH